MNPRGLVPIFFAMVLFNQISISQGSARTAFDFDFSHADTIYSEIKCYTAQAWVPIHMISSAFCVRRGHVGLGLRCKRARKSGFSGCFCKMPKITENLRNLRILDFRGKCSKNVKNYRKITGNIGLGAPIRCFR